MRLNIFLFSAYLFVLSSMICQPAFTTSWQELVDQYVKGKVEEPIAKHLQKNLIIYQQGNAPTIADEKIKHIPILECNEHLVNIQEKCHPRIMMLPDPVRPFSSPDCNSGFPEGAFVREFLFQKLLHMVRLLDKFAPMFGYEAGQINIMIFEGLRSLRTQEQIFCHKMRSIKDANPTMSDEDVVRETSKWVSPLKDNVPPHVTGAAVDLRLWDTKKRAFLDLGIFGVLHGVNETAPTFSENIDDKIKLNRLFCLIASIGADLSNYPYAFWHFSIGDRYDIFQQGGYGLCMPAFYGPISLTE